MSLDFYAAYMHAFTQLINCETSHAFKMGNEIKAFCNIIYYVSVFTINLFVFHLENGKNIATTCELLVKNK